MTPVYGEVARRSATLAGATLTTAERRPLMDSRSQAVNIVGIAWYRREHYARLRNLFRDGRKLPATYDKWLKAANRTLDRYRDQGVIAVKVPIDPEQFPRWCEANGLDVDAQARMRYASLVAKEQYRRLS